MPVRDEFGTTPRTLLKLKTVPWLRLFKHFLKPLGSLLEFVWSDFLADPQSKRNRRCAENFRRLSAKELTRADKCGSALELLSSQKPEGVTRENCGPGTFITPT